MMNQLLIRKEWSTLKKLMFLKAGAGGSLTEYTATGNPVEFSTDVAKKLKECTVAFSPMQSGTGDPYPPGGGKNKFSSAIEQGTIGSTDGAPSGSDKRVRTADYIAVSEGTYTLSIKGTVIMATVFFYDSSKEYLSSKTLSWTSLPMTFTFSGASYIKVAFRYSDNVSDIVPSDVSEIQLETGSPATSFMPYSNIRPISGWTGLNVWQYPENKLEILSNGVTSNGVTYSILKDGNNVKRAVKAKGTRSTTNSFCTLNYVNGTTMSFSPGTYKAYGYTDNIAFRVYIINSGGSEQNVYDSTGTSETFTIPDDAKASWLRLQANTANAIDEIVYPIILPEDDTFNTVAVTFPAEAGTVYGGSLELTTGVLTAEWGGIASYNGETLPGEWLSDRDVYSAGTTPTTGAQVAYELAEPITVATLTPQQITALIGDNTIWSDANGDLTVKFLKKVTS